MRITDIFDIKESVQNEFSKKNKTLAWKLHMCLLKDLLLQRKQSQRNHKMWCILQSYRRFEGQLGDPKHRKTCWKPFRSKSEPQSNDSKLRTTYRLLLAHHPSQADPLRSEGTDIQSGNRHVWHALKWSSVQVFIGRTREEAINEVCGDGNAGDVTRGACLVVTHFFVLK